MSSKSYVLDLLTEAKAEMGTRHQQEQDKLLKAQSDEIAAHEKAIAYVSAQIDDAPVAAPAQVVGS